MVCGRKSIGDLAWLEIRFTLTERGFENFDTVITHLYTYISLLQKEGIKEEYYQELRTLSILDFYYDTEIDIVSESQNLARNLDGNNTEFLFNK